MSLKYFNLMHVVSFCNVHGSFNLSINGSELVRIVHGSFVMQISANGSHNEDNQFLMQLEKFQELHQLQCISHYHLQGLIILFISLLKFFNKFKNISIHNGSNTIISAYILKYRKWEKHSSSLSICNGSIWCFFM